MRLKSEKKAQLDNQQLDLLQLGERNGEIFDLTFSKERANLLIILIFPTDNLNPQNGHSPKNNDMALIKSNSSKSVKNTPLPKQTQIK